MFTRLRPESLFRGSCLLAAGILIWLWHHPFCPSKWQQRLHAALAGDVGWSWQAYTALWLPRAAAVDAILLLAAAALAPWLLRQAPSRITPAHVLAANPVPRGLAMTLIAGVMLGSAVLNAPRLDDSLWSDEEFSMSHFMVGEFEHEKDGTLSWHAVPWARAFWDHRVPNNHAAYSVLAKAAHAGFQPSTGAGDWYFSEWRLRLPAFLAGLLALPMLYLLMQELGLPRAGLAAVVLMAAHPWLVRYSTEARGYGLALFLWPFAVWCLLKGLRTGRWRWWLCFGLAETCLLWSWTGMVHWLLLLNATALGLLFTSPLPAVRFQFRRWMAAGGLAAFCYIPIGLPMVPQLQAWMATGRAKATGIASGWLANSLSWLLTGEPWRSPDPANPLCPGRLETFTNQPVLTVIWFTAGAMAMSWGLVVFWRHSRETRWLLAAMLVPLGTLYIQATVSGNLLMPWYACPALPAVAMLMGGMAEEARRFRAAAPAALLLVFIVLASGHRMRFLLRNHEMEPNRAATALTRSVVNPRHPDYGKGVITAQFSCRRPGYDPGCREIDSVAELETLRQEATGKGWDLYVNIGDAGAAVQRWPDLMARLGDPAQFYPPVTLQGMDHAQTRVVWKAVR